MKNRHPQISQITQMLGGNRVCGFARNIRQTRIKGVVTSSCKRVCVICEVCG